MEEKSTNSNIDLTQWCALKIGQYNKNIFILNYIIILYLIEKFLKSSRLFALTNSINKESILSIYLT